MELRTLEDRCVRGDLIEMYKVVNEHENIDWVIFRVWNKIYLQDPHC